MGRLSLIVAFACLASAHANAQPGAKPATVLENEYVRVSRNIAPCAVASPGTCEDRVILAMGDLTLSSEGKKRPMKRGKLAVFASRQSYGIAVGSPFFEVTIKPKHPRRSCPPGIRARGAATPSGSKSG
ncbi:MAG: hypothetical protein GEU95_01485 [Rhizobiales bacterium]|nr:hypothetical protein [Hyphomicrobiales bacterium]